MSESEAAECSERKGSTGRSPLPGTSKSNMAPNVDSISKSTVAPPAVRNTSNGNAKSTSPEDGPRPGANPAQSTVYVGNLNYSLTGTDIMQIFEKFGRIIRVTVIKDKVTRRSKGSAFILFSKQDEAKQAVKVYDGFQVFGRQIKCSIAKDNGRGFEFGIRREYPDKSRCYECGEFGHVSYNCPKNVFGSYEPKKKRTRESSPYTGYPHWGEVDGEEEDSQSSIKKEKDNSGYPYWGSDSSDDGKKSNEDDQDDGDFSCQLANLTTCIPPVDLSTLVSVPNRKSASSRNGYFSDEEANTRKKIKRR